MTSSMSVRRLGLRLGRKTLSIEEFRYRGETFSAVGIYRGDGGPDG